VVNLNHSAPIGVNTLCIFEAKRFNDLIAVPSKAISSLSSPSERFEVKSER
jgi:hypothetical protein